MRSWASRRSWLGLFQGKLRAPTESRPDSVGAFTCERQQLPLAGESGQHGSAAAFYPVTCVFIGMPLQAIPCIIDPGHAVDHLVGVGTGTAVCNQLTRDRSGFRELHCFRRCHLMRIASPESTHLGFELEDDRCAAVHL